MDTNTSNTHANVFAHTHLFDTTFWQVFPAHYDKIKSHWLKIARLYYEASSALMGTDREAGTNSLKAELDMLEHDIGEYRDVVSRTDKQGIVEIYVIAGRQRWRAEELMREDVEGLNTSLKELLERIKEMKADLVYGFAENERNE